MMVVSLHLTHNIPANFMPGEIQLETDAHLSSIRTMFITRLVCSKPSSFKRGVL